MNALVFAISDGEGANLTDAHWSTSRVSIVTIQTGRGDGAIVT
jgi:hypothetical protein